MSEANRLRALPSLLDVFDPRANTLNLVRLVMAATVIFWHSLVAVTGQQIVPPAVNQLAGQLPVDGFFAISGFLISRSWLGRPQLRSYLVARVGRIFPAYWVCLLATAFLFAPLACLLEGRDVWSLLTSAAPYEYVAKNLLLVVVQHGIGATPAGVPYPGDWNVSLWTLKIEFLCYLLVAAAGVTSLLLRRWTVPVLWLAALALCIGLDAVVGVPSTLSDCGRLALSFASGMLIQRYLHRIPAHWALVVVGALVVVALSFSLRLFGPVAMLPLAYTLLAFGALLKTRALQLHNDVSYGVYIYGFPVTQLLVSTPLVAAGTAAIGVLSLIVTVPLAAASWFWVETPGRRLARRIGHRRSLPAAASPSAIGEN